jgi:hypothetical protein
MSKFTDYIDGFADKTATLARHRLSERDQTFKYTRATTSRKFMITRNKSDYRTDRLPVMTPEEFLAVMGKER